MADYTTGRASGSNTGLWIAGAVVVLVVLLAIFAGGPGTISNTDPAALGTDSAPVTDLGAPAGATDEMAPAADAPVVDQ
jgi:hypothetical protein